MRALKKPVLLAASSIMALLVASCANGSGTDGGGESVGLDGTKEQYIEALADMDPIELSVQTLGPKGSTDDAKDEEYFEAITDWSGGKITFNVNYAQSVATGADIDAAVSSGLLDLATVIPSYSPDKYPTFNELTNLSGALGDDPAASLLQAQAWWAGVPAEVPSFDEEFENQGLKVLVPGYVSAPHSIQCSEPRTTADDFDGVVMRSSEAKVASLLDSVGASAANIPTAEAFEALQRGLVDCEVTSVRVSAKSGTLENAPYVTAAPIGYNSATVVANMDVWESLPIAAQELFLNRLSIYYAANINSGWQASIEALGDLQRYGGATSEADPQVVEAFSAVHEDLFANADPETARIAAEYAETWQGRVEELGFTEVSWDEFPAWYSETQPTPDAFVDVLVAEIIQDES